MISVPCNFTFSFLELVIVSGHAMAVKNKALSEMWAAQYPY